jgi:hypothetical protein
MLVNPIQNKQQSANALQTANGECTFIAGGRLLKQFPKLEQGKTIHFAGDGDWALHDMIIHLLKQTGAAHLTVASFSVSTEAARILTNAYENGYLLSAKFLFDFRTKCHNREAVKLLSGYFPIAYNKVHAKTALISNATWNVSIAGSGNLTANPRTERGFISTDIAVYNFDKNWIYDLAQSFE